ncbi:MAG: class I SAM-dependent rRNA methyltransferase, partial [Bacteroidia bacterium]|nr:class I SAM-dependent rRNA methyltransferase [Bacteroidia bacterium]
QIIDQNYWNEKINKAFLYRKNLNIFNEHTNAYRLVFAEADEIPGLIIDNYNGHFVMQAHTRFIHQQKEYIFNAVKNVFGKNCISFYDKSEFSENKGEILHKDTIISENDLQFYVNWYEGQKTGFFLDQRNNRYCLMKYAKDRVILNTFSYSGGFSVYAGAGGGKIIHSVDGSAKAIEWCNTNMQLNGFDNKHQSFVADVFEFLKNAENNYYDLIVLDPPAFAKSMNHKHSAVQAYKRLNVLAIEKIKKGGILFTFSCSGVIDKELFYNTIAAAGFESNRKIKILDYLYLPPDHVVTPSFPEGEYLKGMVLYIE